MLLLFFILLAALCFISFYTNKYWLVSIVAVGFLQDPVRKLIQGEPVYFVVIVGVLFIAIILSLAFREGVLKAMDPFLKWTSTLHSPLVMFVLVLLFQYLHSILRYQSWTLSSIGLLSYTAPFLAIIVGYYSVNNLIEIRRFMKLYAAIGMLVAASVLLSFYGYDLLIFKEVGTGLKIYDQGTVLRSYSGFMRTGEIASWHIATAACFLVMLVVTSDRQSRKLIAITFLSVVVMLIAITITGRRKMLMLFSLFFTFYSIGHFYYLRSLSLRYAGIIVVVILFGWISIEIIFPGGYGNTFENYFARGASVYSSASERFIALGINPIGWAYNRVGLLGGGLGIASQGSKIFSSVNVAGGAGEGGLGKLMVELGLPGLLVIFWLMIRIVLYLSKTLELSSRLHLQGLIPKKVSSLMVGVAVILIVNTLTFSVATQVYGDVYILILLGLIAGFLFSLPKIATKSMTLYIDK